MYAGQLKLWFQNLGQQTWPPILAVVLLLVCLGGLVRMTLQSFKPSLPTSQTVPVNTLPEPAANIIPQLHLFGNDGTNLSDLPLASLGLQVQGIFINPQPAQSRALINVSGQTQLYGIGDSLLGNVKIYKITKDSVIVSHANRLEKLPLEIQGLDFNSTNDQQGLFSS